MMFIPLLLGIAIVAVVAVIRAEPADEPDRILTIESRPADPLSKAFPHLRLFVPTDEQAALFADDETANSGLAGPDIIIGSARRTAA